MKRYIITSAVPGCFPHEAFLKSLETYATKMKAEILIIPTQGSRKIKDIHPELYEHTVIQKPTRLNDNLFIPLVPLSPEAVDPISGLDRVYGTETSVIYASPKQRLKSIACPGELLPRVLMTTGACTKPHKGITKRALIADEDHVLGALVVEVQSNVIYHYRQVQASKSGSIIDLGIEYHPNGKISNAEVAAIVPGDWHVGYTDPSVRKCTIEMLEQLKPNYLILHDVFDGISVNHHIEHKFLMKAMLGAQNSLSAELQANAIELVQLEKYPKKKLVVVKSNHDQFLDKWLDSGSYVEDTQNHIIGLELAGVMAQGKDPLEYGIKKYTTLKKSIFLKSDDTFKVSDKRIECGMHGHLGPNGSRGSAASLERAFKSSVSGHSHTPEILRQAYVVGTSSYLKLNYNKGPSSWLHTHCIVYQNGSRQLVNIIKGKWRG